MVLRPMSRSKLTLASFIPKVGRSRRDRRNVCGDITFQRKPKGTNHFTFDIKDAMMGLSASGKMTCCPFPFSPIKPTCFFTLMGTQTMQNTLTTALMFLLFLPLTVNAAQPPDWLLYQGDFKTEVTVSGEQKTITMRNGLVQRVWKTTPAGACIQFDNLMTEESLLRGIKPEAIVVLNGEEIPVGGLTGQPNYAFLTNEWLDSGILQADPKAFHFVDWQMGETKERFPWKRVRYLPKHIADAPWPPAGKSLDMRYRLSTEAANAIANSDVAFAKQLEQIEVVVSYEMYDNIPLLAKYISVKNSSDLPVTLNRFDSEVLAFVEVEHSVESRMKLVDPWNKDSTPFRSHTVLSNGLQSGVWLPKIHVESEYEFIGMDARSANEVVRWEPDPQFRTQVNYERTTPCLLKSGLVRLDMEIPPGDEFVSPWTFELIFDSYDRERCGLAQRRMYRTIAPWSCENPIIMHAASVLADAVKLAIDQSAEAGFEMVILTFGSGFNIEDTSQRNIDYISNLVKYANERGIELGGYSLLASRGVGEKDDVTNPVTGKPGGFARFGNSPCLGSEWGERYFEKLYSFYEKTGFNMLEHDGSYPGDYCASTEHPGHNGLNDSQYRQWKTITDFYRWCRERGIYLNVPDWYFLNGSNKTGMGYREDNWSLPRAQQIIHGRQNIYDGTWTKQSSMGWMFVPLTQYHGGGAAATMEPLSENLADYERHLANNFGAGVQACYRGPRLFDTDATKQVVLKYVGFYKKHRDILDSDIIHLRRADGREIDYFLHVNPLLEEKGLLMIYNPKEVDVEKTLRIPLYYTGLIDKAAIFEGDSNAGSVYTLDKYDTVELPIRVPARGIAYYVIKTVCL